MVTRSRRLKADASNEKLYLKNYIQIFFLHVCSINIYNNTRNDSD